MTTKISEAQFQFYQRSSQYGHARSKNCSVGKDGNEIECTIGSGSETTRNSYRNASLYRAIHPFAASSSSCTVEASVPTPSVTAKAPES